MRDFTAPYAFGTRMPERLNPRGLAVSRALALLAGLAPVYQFQAAGASVSAGNTTTIRNSFGGDSLSVVAGTLAAPASDSVFAGAGTITSAATQRMQSGLAGSVWKVLSTGAAFDMLFWACPTATPVGIALSTQGGGALPGMDIIFNNGDLTARVANAAAASVVNLQALASLANNSARLIEFTCDGAGNYALYVGSTLVASGAQTNTPSATDSDALTLFGRTSGTAAASMRYADLVIFNRVLSAAERTSARSAGTTLYGAP